MADLSTSTHQNNIMHAHVTCTPTVLQDELSSLRAELDAQHVDHLQWWQSVAEAAQEQEGLARRHMEEQIAVRVPTTELTCHLLCSYTGGEGGGRAFLPVGKLAFESGDLCEPSISSSLTQVLNSFTCNNN